MVKNAILIASVVLAGCTETQNDSTKNDFDRWSEQAENRDQIRQFQSLLKKYSVDEVFPIEHLLRSDVSWKKCQSEPFVIPPKNEWHNLIPTLQFIRDELIPVIGTVEIQSAYRHPKINKCIGGASRSFHLRFFAIDMHPTTNISRSDLVAKLCKLHKSDGEENKFGLGIYKAKRFHIDTAGYRTWGQDYTASSSPCLSNVAAQHQTR